ncbi:hypothetical protein E4T56_gene3 [Termitomyces sp. T112]|nr:hypothetical protein E4T56_gene3 [Termitomyces sp. T112]
MLVATLFKSMSRSGARASTRTRAVAQQIMFASTSAAQPEPPVLFKSDLAVRTYILNRPSVSNTLDEPMLTLLRPKIEEWSTSDLCRTIVGTSVGGAFCAGGDVKAVLENCSSPETRSQAIDFFKREFELDYILATLSKPYVAILDGITMGGGAGLAAYASFRIATENTVFAMPETKIGYFPDVGGSYFMSRLDGELGTYLSLTGGTIRGRDVFRLGFATHYIPSRRVPILLDRLASLEKAHVSVINSTVEEFSAESSAAEKPYLLVGETREALDYAFRHDQVEKIFEDLEAFVGHSSPAVSEWARQTLETLHLRSPTSLKVALKAIRKGKKMTLLETLQMELNIATAFCNGASPDFKTGITAFFVTKKRSERPAWSPSSYKDVSDELVSRFFAENSPYLSGVPTLSISEVLKGQETSNHKPHRFALPTEDEIGAMVRGSHRAGTNTGITLDELVSSFENIQHHKMGVQEKVLEVARRKCEIQDNGGDGNFVWLKWKHQHRL